MTKSKPRAPKLVTNRLDEVRGGVIVIIVEKKVTSPRDTSTGQASG